MISLPNWGSDLWIQTLDWAPEKEHCQRFEQLYQLVLTGNGSQNLTRLTDPEEFLEKHVWDSLRGIRSLGSFPTLPTAQKVIDLGTGAGFPGIPAAIVFPGWQFTLLDATRRKIAFVNQTLAELGLSQSQGMAERAEQVGQDRTHRERYNLALLRAIGGASLCAEYSLPCLVVGGQAILYRGHWTTAEETSLSRAVETLGGDIVRVDAFTTPLTQGVRHCVVVKKVKATPSEFPRATGIPSRDPLG